MTHTRQFLKRHLAGTLFHQLWIRANQCYSACREFIDQRTSITRWKIKGCPPPPPRRYKQMVVQEYGTVHGTRVLIETGTHKGDMVYACRGSFERIYSIELDPTLFYKAGRRFKSYSHIQILEGDSSNVLPGILEKLEVPALFWLDGHYSGGITAKGYLSTPIMRELELVLAHKIKQHVILIDDARDFTGEDDYPKLDVLIEWIKKSDPLLTITVQHDIIRIHRKPSHDQQLFKKMRSIG